MILPTDTLSNKYSFYNWDQSDLELCIAEAHQAGFRTFAASQNNRLAANVQNHLDLYNLGIDVAYTYNQDNANDARIEVNTQNGVFPAWGM